jgi:hypothetical protein
MPAAISPPGHYERFLPDRDAAALAFPALASCSTRRLEKLSPDAFGNSPE